MKPGSTRTRESQLEARVRDLESFVADALGLLRRIVDDPDTDNAEWRPAVEALLEETV